ncbi:MAG: hypothetical protein ACE366_28435 [Bradymonadia bacterium]
MKRALKDVREVEQLYWCMSKVDPWFMCESIWRSLRSLSPVHKERLSRLSLRLAEQAIDRVVLHWAIILMGVTPDLRHLAIFDLAIEVPGIYAIYKVLGRWPQKMRPDSHLMALVKRHGKHSPLAVPHMRWTTNPEIQRWILFEGLGSYEAYDSYPRSCAEGAAVHNVLAQPSISDAAFAASAQIIVGLNMTGMRGEGLMSYRHGPIVYERILYHLSVRPEPSFETLRIMHSLKGTLHHMSRESIVARRRLFQAGWSQAVRERLQASISCLLERPGWKAMVRAQLENPTGDFEAAFYLGKGLYQIDPWPYIHQHMQASGGWWGRYFGCADTEERLSAALRVAELRLMQGAGGITGPASPLNVVLRALRDHPGMGWQLVRMGLKSGDDRIRATALIVLETRPRETWPPYVERVYVSMGRVLICSTVRHYWTLVRLGLPIQYPPRRIFKNGKRIPWQPPQEAT